MKKPGGITRRDFLRGAAGLLVAGPMAVMAEEAPRRARVVVIRDAGVLGPNGEIGGDVLASMLDKALGALLDEKEALGAWQRIVKPSDTVGVKSNVWRNLPTPPELEQVIRRRLTDVGIPESRIAVDDRGVLGNPVFLKSTALVNARPLRTHHWSGVGTCLKNYIMFVRTPSAYHDNGCSELGKIWTQPIVKGKTRLNVLVALTPQFYGRGANFFDRRYVWPYKGLIVGTDPVAVDTVGAELLRLKRIAHFGEDRSLDVQPVHIAVADRKYGLGVSDLGRIEIVKIGWNEEMLI